MLLIVGLSVIQEIVALPSEISSTDKSDIVMSLGGESFVPAVTKNMVIPQAIRIIQRTLIIVLIVILELFNRVFLLAVSKLSGGGMNRFLNLLPHSFILGFCLEAKSTNHLRLCKKCPG